MSETELIRTSEETGELTVEQLVGQMEKLRDVMRRAMKEGEDYGAIPGTGGKKKPLFQPGGEKLAMMFRLAPSYVIVQNDLPGGHREFSSTCRLTHIPTGKFCGEATASCSSLEPKYRYRGGSILCTNCGKETVIKGKKEFGGGWLCWAKKGGCGAKFPESEFSEAQIEKQENPDIAGEFNTIVQMAQKRSFLRAIRTATASSELFTQDIEDGVVPGVEVQHQNAADDRRPYGVPPGEIQKPKPREETREWLALKAALVTLGCTPGRVEEARAVISYVMPGITLEEARAAPDAARTVLDALDGAMVCNTAIDLLREALVAAGLKTVEPAGAGT